VIRLTHGKRLTIFSFAHLGIEIPTQQVCKLWAESPTQVLEER